MHFSELFQNSAESTGIPLPYILPQNRENQIFYANGLSKIMPRLKLKVHSEIETCFYLWEKFSPKASLFDLWDFRFAWFSAYQFTPYFYTVYEGRKPLAVLPLWYDDVKKRYEWFGSEWMEENQFFVKDKEFIKILLKLIPQSFYLNSLAVLPNDLFKEVVVSQDDDKYLKNIKDMKTMKDCLLSMDKKHRYNLKRDYHYILSFQPRVEIIESNNFEEFKPIIGLSNYRFNGEEDEESDLVKAERVAVYKAILKNSGLYQTKFIKVFIQDYLAAVDLNITCKKRYYTVRGGNDVERFSGIGNFLVYLEFEDAIKNSFEVIDCLQEDYGWKHKYFQAQKMWVLEK